MKNARIYILTWFFLTIAVLIITRLIADARRAPDPQILAAQHALELEKIALARERLTQLERDRLHLQRRHLQRNADLQFYGALSLIAAASLSFLILALGQHRARVKRASVHAYRLGPDHEIIVRERDLALAAPIALGLINAEQLRQVNGGLEKALQLYTHLADVQTRQLHALLRNAPRRAPDLDPALAASLAPALPDPFRRPPAPPTFHDLLASGEIAPGKPMILGYENGLPRRGSFLDIYSAAVAGESGSGKTATLLFLIASALVAMPVRFLGIDPHYPHPKSLGAKTKPLWQAGLMTMATFKDDMLHVLRQVERAIDRRLHALEDDAVPVVLVLDELAFLSKTPLGPAIARTMERISMEGRKCQVYMLASSQTWLAARTGDSSVVRDTLTSAYVHRIKPRQANLLLQDRDEAAKVKKYVKRAGEALLCPVGGASVIVQIPLTTDADLRRVAEIMAVPPVTASDNFIPETPSDAVTPAAAHTCPSTGPSDDSPAVPAPDPPELLDRLKTALGSGQTYGDVQRATGIAKSTLYNYVNARGSLRPDQITALAMHLRPPDAAPAREASGAAGV